MKTLKENRQEIGRLLSESTVLTDDLDFEVYRFRTMPAVKPATIRVTTMGSLPVSVRSLNGGTVMAQQRFAVVLRVQHENDAPGDTLDPGLISMETAEDMLDDAEAEIVAVLSAYERHGDFWRKLVFTPVSRRPSSPDSLSQTRYAEIFIQVFE